MALVRLLSRVLPRCPQALPNLLASICHKHIALLLGAILPLRAAWCFTSSYPEARLLKQRLWCLLHSASCLLACFPVEGLVSLTQQPATPSYHAGVSWRPLDLLTVAQAEFKLVTAVRTWFPLGCCTPPVFIVSTMPHTPALAVTQPSTQPLGNLYRGIPCPRRPAFIPTIESKAPPYPEETHLQSCWLLSIFQCNTNNSSKTQPTMGLVKSLQCPFVVTNFVLPN